MTSPVLPTPPRPVHGLGSVHTVELDAALASSVRVVEELRTCIAAGQRRRA